MSKEITYGPIGTTLIQVSNEFYLAYEINNQIYYWSINAKDIPNISEIDNVTYNKDGILSNDIEGFQYIEQSDWEDLIIKGEVFNAGVLTDVQDTDMSIDSMINTIINIENELPWTKTDEYKQIVTEYLIEDPINWLANLNLDAEGKLFGTSGLITQLGFSKNEYQIATKYSTDPLGREELVDDTVIVVKEMLNALEANLDEDTIYWVAEQVAKGSWSNKKLNAQLTAATQSGSIYELDDEFKTILSTGVVTPSTQGQTEITKLLDTWLPKQLHQPYLDRLNELSGKYVNDSNFQDEFIEQLKNERFAFNSNWDKEIAWFNIINNATSLAQNTWGVVPEFDDPGILQMVTTNDVNQQQEIARQIGLDRGYEKTSIDFFNAINKSLGGSSNVGGANVVRTQDYNIRAGGNK